MYKMLHYLVAYLLWPRRSSLSESRLTIASYPRDSLSHSREITVWTGGEAHARSGKCGGKMTK